MILRYPSRKWKLSADAAQQIKDHLLAQGGIEDTDIKSEQVGSGGLTRTRYIVNRSYSTLVGR